MRLKMKKYYDVYIQSFKGNRDTSRTYKIEAIDEGMAMQKAYKEALKFGNKIEYIEVIDISEKNN